MKVFQSFHYPWYRQSPRPDTQWLWSGSSRGVCSVRFCIILLTPSFSSTEPPAFSSVQNALLLWFLLRMVLHLAPFYGWVHIVTSREIILMALESESFYCVSWTYICSVIYIVLQWLYLSHCTRAPWELGNDNFYCYFKISESIVYSPLVLFCFTLGALKSL